MDIKKCSAAIVAAIALTGAVSSCTTKPITGHAVASQEPMDELVNWANPWQPGMPVPTIWGLVVHRLIDVKEEYADDYFGAALIRDDEPCFALLSNRDERGHMGARMLSRHNNAFAAQTGPLDKSAFTTWILTNGLECAAQATK